MNAKLSREIQMYSRS